MARGLWKGAISFGLVNVPVELYSAQKKSAELDLTMLDKRDLAPVGFKRVNKESGDEVPWRSIVKGYEYKEGEFVVLSNEDFRRANPEATKTVDIHAFVDLAAIPPQYFDTPYFLSPGKRGEKAYALLRDALAKAGKAGIASVVIRTKQYLAALIPQDGVLVLNTLRYFDELKTAQDIGVAEKLKGVRVGAKELDMALRLVKDMEEDWRPEQFKDTYREDILERVKEKVKAGETEEVTRPGKGKEKEPGGEVIDLMALLKKSVEKSDKPKRHARKRRAA